MPDDTVSVLDGGTFQDSHDAAQFFMTPRLASELAVATTSVELA